MRKLRIVLDSVLNFSSGASGSEIKLNFYLFRDTKFPKMSKKEGFFRFQGRFFVDFKSMYAPLEFSTILHFWTPKICRLSFCTKFWAYFC